MERGKVPDRPPNEAAAAEDARRFLRGLGEHAADLRPEEQAAAVKRYVDQFPLGELQTIARRIMMDLMRPPPPPPRRRHAEPGPEVAAAAPPKRDGRRGGTPRKREPRRR